MSKDIDLDVFRGICDFDPIRRVSFRSVDGKLVPTSPTTLTFSGEYRINSFINQIRNGDIDKLIGFTQAFYLYVLPRYHHLFSWDMESSATNSRRTLLQILRDREFPLYASRLVDIWHDHDYPSFEDYLYFCSEHERLSFNLKSALDVYAVQGVDGIMNIIYQVFTPVNDEPYDILIDKTAPPRVPTVSPYISGTFFPCLVSEQPKKLRSRSFNNAILLEMMDSNGIWKVYDIYCIGNFNLFNRPLGERLNFFSAGGQVSKNFICYNYNDIVEARKQIGKNCVIRNLRETLLSTSWFLWGEDSYINIVLLDDYIMGVNGKTHLMIDRSNNSTLPSWKTKKQYITIDMCRHFVENCNKSDIIFTRENIDDFFYLLNL